jgi:hypothetical protein
MLFAYNLLSRFQIIMTLNDDIIMTYRCQSGKAYHHTSTSPFRQHQYESVVPLASIGKQCMRMCQYRRSHCEYNLSLKYKLDFLTSGLLATGPLNSTKYKKNSTWN